MDKTCEYCEQVSQGFCSKCGSAHCESHAMEIPDEHPFDEGETGLICPECAVDLIVAFHDQQELISKAAEFVKASLNLRGNSCEGVDEEEDNG